MIEIDQSKRIRSQKHCWICKSNKYGPEIYYKYAELNTSLQVLSDFYCQKLGYKGNQGKFACTRALKAHFTQEHKPAWLLEAEELAIKKESDKLSIKFGEKAIKLYTDLTDGKITDDAYLNKVKLLAYTNMLRFPEKVSVKQGLEAINLAYKKEALGVQKSESLRNWMKLISGKPDKTNDDRNSETQL